MRNFLYDYPFSILCAALYRKYIIEKRFDYYFSVDSVAMLDNPGALKDLLEIKRYACHRVQVDYIGGHTNFYPLLLNNNTNLLC